MLCKNVAAQCSGNPLLESEIDGGGSVCLGSRSSIIVQKSFIEQTYNIYRNDTLVFSRKGKGTDQIADSFHYTITVLPKDTGKYTVKTFIEGCTDTLELTPVNPSFNSGDNSIKIQFLVGGGPISGKGTYCPSFSDVNIGISTTFAEQTYIWVFDSKVVSKKKGKGTSGNGDATSYNFNISSQSEAGLWIVKTYIEGCKDTLQYNPVQVNYYDAEPAKQTVTGGGSFCSNSGRIIGLAATEKNYEYTLVKDSVPFKRVLSSVVGKGDPLTFPPVFTSGTYRVMVVKGFSCGDDVEIGTADLEFLPAPSKPIISKNGVTELCTGGSVQLSSSVPAGNQWFRDGVQIPNETNNTFSASISGTYTVQTTGSGCTSPVSDGVTVTVSPLPEAIVTSEGSPTVCENGSVILKANTGAGLSYQWRKDGNNLPGATSASYTSTSQGAYDVLVSSTNGCSKSSNTINVSVLTGTSKPIITKDASGSSTVCAGSSITLTSSASTGNKWFRNGVEIPNAVSNTYNASLGGVYTVQVSTNSCVSPLSDGTEVTVTPLPEASIVAAGPTSFCENGNVLLNANTGQGLTYVWRKDGNSIAGATSPSYTATLPGVYEVVVSTASGCAQTSKSVSVEVSSTLPKPLISKEGGVTNVFCAGSQVTLKSSAPSGNKWFRDGVEIPNATGSSYLVTSGGVYTVQVSANNCTSPISEAVALTVTDLPDATINASGPTAFCENGSLTLSANSGTGLSYQWRKDGTNISGASAASYTLNTTGSYDVVVINQAGCLKISNTIQATVQSSSKPSISVSGATTFCSGQSVTLNSSTPTGNKWYRDGVQIQNSNNNSLLVSSGGKYTVQTEGNGCISPMSDGITVTVNTLPEAIISASGPTAICGNSALQLSANSGTGQSYQWRKDGTDIPGATSANLGVTTSGSYDVIVKNQSGCANTSNSIKSSINPLPPKPVITKDGNDLVSSAADGNQWFLDNSPVPGATGKRHTPEKSGNYKVKVTLNGCESEFSDIVSFVVTGIINLPNSQFIKVFPNPAAANGTVYLAWKLDNAPKGLRVHVVNPAGHIISMSTITDPLASLKFPGIAGMYYLRVWVIDNEAANYTLKVVVH